MRRLRGRGWSDGLKSGRTEEIVLSKGGESQERREKIYHGGRRDWSAEGNGEKQLVDEALEAFQDSPADQEKKDQDKGGKFEIYEDQTKGIEH